MLSVPKLVPQRAGSLSRKLKVTLLSSEWWSRKGGISTLNRVLAIQLAKHPLVEVTIFVLECSEDEEREAVSHNINVVKAARQPGLEQNTWLCFPPNHLQIDIVIGHGAVLGAQAKIISENRQCKWVQVVHTAPKELGMFKSYTDAILKGEAKHQVEVELGEMADVVVGVGPKLCEAFRPCLRWCKKNPDDVINLTPGIFKEYSEVEQAPQDGSKCRVLTFGRGDEEDFRLKGFDIAAKAVAELSDTILIFAGARDEDLEQVARRFLECGISPEHLLVSGFLENKYDLRKLFCQADLALMPSRTEGFGLTALEALSAGLPVLVSHNSGFAEALSNIPFGSFCVIESTDASVWADAIRRVWKKSRERRLHESGFLRTAYEDEYSWEKQCNELVTKMLNITAGMACEMQKPSDEGHQACARVEEEVTPVKTDRDESDKKFKSECLSNAHEHGRQIQGNATRELHQNSTLDEERKYSPRMELEEESQKKTMIKRTFPSALSASRTTHLQQMTDLEGENIVHNAMIIERKLSEGKKITVGQELSLENVSGNGNAQTSGTMKNEIFLENNGKEELREKEAVVEELEKRLEDELGKRKTLEEELRQQRTVCTGLEETIQDVLQMSLTIQSENYARKLQEQESRDDEAIFHQLNFVDKEQAQIRLEEELSQTRITCTELRERLDDLMQVCGRMESESSVQILREQELMEKETVLAETQETLSGMKQANARLEEELSQARTSCTELEIKLVNERAWKNDAYGNEDKREQQLEKKQEKGSKMKKHLDKHRQTEIAMQEKPRQARSAYADLELRRMECEKLSSQSCPREQRKKKTTTEIKTRNLERAIKQERKKHFSALGELQSTVYEGRQHLPHGMKQANARLEEELSQARTSCTELETKLVNERAWKNDAYGNEDKREQQLEKKQEKGSKMEKHLDKHRQTEIAMQEKPRQARSAYADLERRMECEKLSSQPCPREQRKKKTTTEMKSRNLERVIKEERKKQFSALRELQSTVYEGRQHLPHDWVIQREEVVLSDSVLGRGGWGRVRKGTFRSCNVAVKEIHEVILSPLNRRLFEREISMASRCRHPNLLQFIGATNDDGSPLFVTELLDTSLRDLLSLRALTQEEIVGLSLDVARGLNYLHLNKPLPIIHRDISSANVLLWKRDRRWRAKLSDYGSANFLQQAMTFNAGAVIYSAPDAFTFDQSPKVDVYSFGVLLCEMCIRELPDPQEILRQIRQVTNGTLRRLVLRCVQRNPEVRPSISEAIDKLEELSSYN